MSVRRVLLLACVLALISALPAGARPAGPTVGIGEQHLGWFTSKKFKPLKIRDARYITPWDTLHDPARLAWLDEWMAQAGKAKMRVLLGFTHSVRSRKLAHYRPTVKQYRKEFLRIHARYPWVKDWIVWNEANNGYSLMSKKPKLVARYYNSIARRCKGCRIVGADVADQHSLVPWIKQFRRYARPYPRYWGLHNYIDSNYFYTRGTQWLLSLTKGKIWFTETGGVVYRRMYRAGKLVKTFRWGGKRAAKATRQVFKLACLSGRITRVYFYHWIATKKKTNWDSALLDARGRPRASYWVLRKWMKASVRASKKGGRRALCNARL